jgi:hypothetical protein
VNDGIHPFYRLIEAPGVLEVPDHHFDLRVPDHAAILQQVAHHEPWPTVIQRQVP